MVTAPISREVASDVSLHVSLRCVMYRVFIFDTLYSQVGGFLQRIDYVRKYAFGVMAILKNEKGQFPIRCSIPPRF